MPVTLNKFKTNYYKIGRYVYIIIFYNEYSRNMNETNNNILFLFI